MRTHTRIGTLCLAILLSLITLSLLLSSSEKAHTITQQWPLSAVKPDVSMTGDAAVFNTGGKPPEGGLRIVVLGDSWVDDPSIEQDEANKARGKSWTELLCEELHCTSYLNFAAPALHDAEEGQVGAVISNELASEVSNITHMMPDLPAQLTAYLAFPPPTIPTNILVILSFGIWDVYKYASLPRAQARAKIDHSMTSLVSQLDILHSYLSVTHKWALEEVVSENITENGYPNTARLLVPRLFDPTFLPGWSSRPWPKTVISDAEELKDTVYLVDRWNALLEETLKNWLKTGPQAPVPAGIKADTQGKHEPGPPTDIHHRRGVDQGVANEDERDSGRRKTRRSRTPAEKEASKPDQDDGGGSLPPTKYDTTLQHPRDLEWQPWAKEAYLFDLPQVIVNSIRERQLVDGNLSDGEGLGMSPSPYISVQQPCIVPRRMGELKAREEAVARREAELADVFMNREAELVEETHTERDETAPLERRASSSTQDICAEPEKYLFWDDWHVGPQAHWDIAHEAAKLLRDGSRLEP